jgi:hypothetical protein
VRRRSLSPTVSPDWPFHLRQIIHAARHECPRGHASALMELTALALTKVPARGILDPTVRGEHELFAEVESVANRHLGLRRARRRWRTALLRTGAELEALDEIERAALEVQAISDTAYFYSGLAFGLTFMTLYRSS